MAGNQTTEQLMRRYGELMNAGVQDGKTDGEQLAAMFAENCVASSPAGIAAVTAGANYAKMIEDGIANYRRIGGTAFIIEHVKVQPVNEQHDLARVEWRFNYMRPADGKFGTIRFENVYFITRVDPTPKIFAWVTPDEQAALKEHGLA
jgi:hypothetical protein